LSIAAQLAARGIEHRIIGSPMQFWMEHMPKGMQLKSEGFASSLYDASGHFTLRRYCAEHDLAYRDIGLPCRSTRSADMASRSRSARCRGSRTDQSSR